MEAVHFGRRSLPLLGLWHRAEGTKIKQTGIVICPAWGLEYMRSYRGMRLLAKKLAEAGFDVLRFDYSSTGDSEGASLDARVAQWQADIGYAAEELRELADKPQIALFGLRLGGLLAQAALKEKQARAQHLVTWDAPTSGRDFVALMQRHSQNQDAYKNRGRPPNTQLPAHQDNELCGHAWPSALSSAIEALPGLQASSSVITIESADLHATTATDSKTHPNASLVLQEKSHWHHYRWAGTPWIPAAAIHALVPALAQQLP